MCTESTQFYRGSGSNFHTNSMRQWATLTRQSQGERLHIEGTSGSGNVPVVADTVTLTATSEPKKMGVTAMKMPKAAPVPMMAKLSESEAE